MSVLQPALFFLSLPDLQSLCCVTLSLDDNYDEPRTKQISTCRELVLLFSDVLASPGLDSFTEITAVMAVQVFQSGVLESFIQRHSLQINAPQPVLPGILQACFSFSLISRLSPKWNKAGLYLIHGRGFLSESGRLKAVSLEFSIGGGQLCLSVLPSAVRLPPVQLQDFSLSPVVLRRFSSDTDTVIHPQQLGGGGGVWCYVLPSMKKGQIITVTRKLPPGGPFRDYRELQSHWNRLYGYMLPDQDEDQVVYCSVFFRLVGERLFTYPLCCIRLSPVQRCPRVDLQAAISCFMVDLRETLPSVCGFPTRISTTPRFTTTALSPLPLCSNSQFANTQIPGALNLSDISTSRAVLSHLPPPPPRPLRPVFGSQPAHLGPVSFSCGSSFSQPSCSSFSDFFKPASTVNPFFTVFQSPPSLEFLSVAEKPKLVPAFRSVKPSQLVNVALLKSQKQGRITRPVAANHSKSRQQAPAVYAPTVKSVNVKHIPTFSPKNKVKPALAVAPGVDKENKKSVGNTVVKFNLEKSRKSSALKKTAEGVLKTKSALKVQAGAEKTSTTLTQAGVKKNCGGKKNPGQALKEVDVEQMARSNQLSCVRSVVLLQWLSSRGMKVQTKLPKDQLMLKVMSCLAES
ncbi:unnamed protein product [Knipowitschia caucasica]|uniref:DUF4708 domain-containing protein n=1 Tax=Knipowitschia caucasica TaxID=637954 RepID=A0AAV2L665_KNICA